MKYNKIAILIDSDDKHSPSDTLALKKFEQAAIKCGLTPYFIMAKDIEELKKFNALFIRCMTAESHYSMDFVKKAKELNIISLDNENTILYGSNKANYYKHMMNLSVLDLNKIKIPKTYNLAEYLLIPFDCYTLKFPIICKSPNGFFCENVKKIENRKELNEIFNNDPYMLLQEYIPTSYDWRIGILNNKPLFACKYWMAKDHWQIAKHENDSIIWGDVECIDLKYAPQGVIDLAIASTKVIGETGLFGVDIKDYNGQYYLIEVNDNPNIEAGFEDQFLGDKIYLDIMQWYASELYNMELRGKHKVRTFCK